MHICNALNQKCSVYSWNIFSVITYTTFVRRFSATCERQFGRELPEGAVLWEKRTSPGYINFREKGALMGAEEWGVAREGWVSTGNETAPLPAFSAATPKTEIASCVTNEPTLTYPPDLWQSVLPPSSRTCVAGDETSTDNSWFLFLHERKEKNKKDGRGWRPFSFSLLLLHSPRRVQLNV